MKTLIKLNSARQKIREMDVKKLGRNSYSNYDYFTPEQISSMVAKVNYELGLLTKFDLLRTELGLMAFLEVIDVDTGESITFKMATDIPSIKATNIAQQLGGCVTYSERYLNMIAYDIKDNSLDFDAKDNRDLEVKLTKEQVNELDILLSKTNYDDAKKDEVYNTFSSLKQSQFDSAKAKLMMDERSPSENENYSQATINNILDSKV